MLRKEIIYLSLYNTVALSLKNTGKNEFITLSYLSLTRSLEYLLTGANLFTNLCEYYLENQGKRKKQKQRMSSPLSDGSYWV